MHVPRALAGSVVFKDKIYVIGKSELRTQNSQIVYLTLKLQNQTK